jgi:hypothetical protein
MMNGAKARCLRYSLGQGFRACFSYLSDEFDDGLSSVGLIQTHARSQCLDSNTRYHIGHKSTHRM